MGGPEIGRQFIEAGLIDEIHLVMGAGGAAGQGALDAASLLKPPLARGELCCIGATTAAEPPAWLSLEHRSIAQACRETLSVAEVAARVDLPLGVTRVLVGDLAAQGMVTVHRAPSHAGGPNVALLEQVLHGLQRL